MALESASIDEAQIQNELGLPTDEALENQIKEIEIELSQNYEPSSKSIFDEQLKEVSPQIDLINRFSLQIQRKPVKK